MDYATARQLIQTGDLIAVRDIHGLLGRATIAFTDSPYTHTGVAVWLGGRLFMADLNSGRNHLTPLSQLSNFDVFDPPPGLDRIMIELAIFDWLAEPIAYGFAAFVVIGIKEALGINAFIHWRKIVVCSGGSVTIYEMAAAKMRDAGLIPPPAWIEHTRMLSPGTLARELEPQYKIAVRAATKSTPNETAREAVF